uniref:Uncharacterized protein n=1 Tax=Hyaloperonospora arabidopsidis (strain Emoy2) TaxID=559515 RepID=M4BMK7_HYAAE
MLHRPSSSEGGRNCDDCVGGSSIGERCPVSGATRVHISRVMFTEKSKHQRQMLVLSFS